MFVEITKKDNNSPIGMDALFKKQREEGITPEFAMEVLESTNHYGNIKKVAKYILSLETVEERLAYKDFVISAVDGRETTPDGFDMLYMLARDGGYNKEFFEAYNNPKQYDINYCNLMTQTIICKSEHDDLPQDVREFDRVVLDYSVYTSGRANPSIEFACKECCFKNISNIRVSQHAKGYIGAEKFRFSNIGSVEHHIGEGTKFVEYTDCGFVKFDVYNNNRHNAEDSEIVGKNVDKILMLHNGFWQERNIKCNFENVSELELCDFDLSLTDLNSFKGLKNISFRYCSDFPKKLDFSSLDSVSMLCKSNSRFECVEEIKFKEGAKFCMEPYIFDDGGTDKIEIPPHIDFSKCSEVTLSGSLAQYDTLSFGEGAKVNFVWVEKFPKVLDVSMCDEVIFRRKIDNVNNVIFKDMAQLEDVAKKSCKDEKEQKQFLSKLKKKAKFVNKEKSSGFLSKIWERGG